MKELDWPIASIRNDFMASAGIRAVREYISPEQERSFGDLLILKGISMNGSWAKSMDQVSEQNPVAAAKAGTGTLPTWPHSQAAQLRPASLQVASLTDRFEAICGLFADKVAVTCGAQEMTYHALNLLANGFASRLATLNLKEESIVAIYLDRSIPMIAAMLGVLKAGGAYLPIDPTYPPARVAQTLEDACPAVVITEQKLAAALPSLQAEMLLVDSVGDGSGSNPPLKSAPRLLAYLMYTSGSTGKPKGVLVTHGNVLRLFTETEPWFNFDENDVWTMFHSFAFDFSVWEIWGPLLTGGRLVIVPFEISRSTEDFYALLSKEKVTVLNQTPSAFSLIDQVEARIEAQPEGSGKLLPLALRTVIFGGEALQYRALRNWFKRHGDRKPQLINMYGITETTVHVTYRVVTEADSHAEIDSLIGEPIPDLQIHLLDPDGHPVPDGEEGELCIGGAGVARGYLNRPELTAQRFVPDTFSPDGGLLYRSGDIGRRRADGQLVYLGRNDSQVKINGFRIELGEVEAAIAEFPGIRQVCVLAHTDSAGRSRLAAYFVSTSGESIAASTLREFLAGRSPAQMVPAFYIQVPGIPLTHNGKVDRKALPVPTAGSSAPVSVAGSPVQERIAAIWRNVLEAPNVGLDDNFFDIGGSSILLIQVRTQLQTDFGRQIPITWMFEFTTIRALADKLQMADASSSPAAAASNGVIDAVQEQARKQREAFARMRAARVPAAGGGR